MKCYTSYLKNPSKLYKISLHNNPTLLYSVSAHRSALHSFTYFSYLPPSALVCSIFYSVSCPLSFVSHSFFILSSYFLVSCFPFLFYSFLFCSLLLHLLVYLCFLVFPSNSCSIYCMYLLYDLLSLNSILSYAIQDNNSKN